MAAVPHYVMCQIKLDDVLNDRLRQVAELTPATRHLLWSMVHESYETVAVDATYPSRTTSQNDMDDARHALRDCETSDAGDAATRQPASRIGRLLGLLVPEESAERRDREQDRYDLLAAMVYLQMYWDVNTGTASLSEPHMRLDSFDRPAYARYWELYVFRTRPLFDIIHKVQALWMGTPRVSWASRELELYVLSQQQLKNARGDAVQELCDQARHNAAAPVALETTGPLEYARERLSRLPSVIINHVRSYAEHAKAVLSAIQNGDSSLDYLCSSASEALVRSTVAAGSITSAIGKGVTFKNRFQDLVKRLYCKNNASTKKAPASVTIPQSLVGYVSPIILGDSHHTTAHLENDHLVSIDEIALAIHDAGHDMSWIDISDELDSVASKRRILHPAILTFIALCTTHIEHTALPIVPANTTTPPRVFWDVMTGVTLKHGTEGFYQTHFFRTHCPITIVLSYAHCTATRTHMARWHRALMDEAHTAAPAAAPPDADPSESSASYPGAPTRDLINFASVAVYAQTLLHRPSPSHSVLPSSRVMKQFQKGPAPAASGAAAKTAPIQRNNAAAATNVPNARVPPPSVPAAPRRPAATARDSDDEEVDMYADAQQVTSVARKPVPPPAAAAPAAAVQRTPSAPPPAPAAIKRPPAAPRPVQTIAARTPVTIDESDLIEVPSKQAPRQKRGRVDPPAKPAVAAGKRAKTDATATDLDAQHTAHELYSSMQRLCLNISDAFRDFARLCSVPGAEATTPPLRKGSTIVLSDDDEDDDDADAPPVRDTEDLDAEERWALEDAESLDDSENSVEERDNVPVPAGWAKFDTESLFHPLSHLLARLVKPGKELPYGAGAILYQDRKSQYAVPGFVFSPCWSAATLAVLNACVGEDARGRPYTADVHKKTAQTYLDFFASQDRVRFTVPLETKDAKNQDYVMWTALATILRLLYLPEVQFNKIAKKKKSMRSLFTSVKCIDAVPVRPRDETCAEIIMHLMSDPCIDNYIHLVRLFNEHEAKLPAGKLVHEEESEAWSELTPEMVACIPGAVFAMLAHLFVVDVDGDAAGTAAPMDVDAGADQSGASGENDNDDDDEADEDDEGNDDDDDDGADVIDTTGVDSDAALDDMCVDVETGNAAVPAPTQVRARLRNSASTAAGEAEQVVVYDEDGAPEFAPSLMPPTRSPHRSVVPRSKQDADDDAALIADMESADGDDDQVEQALVEEDDAEDTGAGVMPLIRQSQRAADQAALQLADDAADNDDDVADEAGDVIYEEFGAQDGAQPAVEEYETAQGDLMDVDQPADDAAQPAEEGVPEEGEVEEDEDANGAEEQAVEDAPEQGVAADDDDDDDDAAAAPGAEEEEEGAGEVAPDADEEALDAAETGVSQQAAGDDDEEEEI